MAFVAMNGYDVEHASQLLVYENLFPQIQHLNGKGVTDTYTKPDDIEKVTFIDVMRPLPYPPRFRQIGGAANGAWHNAKNVGGVNNAPQSTHYTIPVDLICDEGFPILSAQEYSNPVALKQIILAQYVNTSAMNINVITFAKQIEGFFRVGDNFHKAKTHKKGNIVAGDVTDEEVAAAVYQFDPTKTGVDPDAATSQFLDANASLNEGILSIGALSVPAEERQAFITPNLNRLMKNQYMMNASEAAARILGNGVINPFNGRELDRIDTRTGLCGMYDGVDLFMVNKVTRQWVYVALGILGTADDTAGNLPAARAALDNLEGFICYAGTTLRGIVGPTIEVNKQVTQGGVYVVPQMKVACHVLTGEGIKFIVNKGEVTEGTAAHAWGKSTVIMLMNTLGFTPIDGVTVKGNLAGFNDGTSN